MFVFLNDKFVAAGAAKVSVGDHGFLYGDGVYETLRTFGGKLWRPERHLKRLFWNMEEMGISAIWSEEELLGWIEEGVAKNGFSETRVRVTVTRGENGFEVLEVGRPTLVITFGCLRELRDEYEMGVKVKIVEAERALPRVKTVSMAPVMKARLEKERAGVFEVLLMNRDGNVTEGSVTNVFVVRGGKVFTSRDGVLEGTMAGLVKEWCEVGEMELGRDDLYTADEVFLTNALVGVVPVVEVDGYIVGEGRPGGVAMGLIEEFKKLIDG